MSQTEQEARSDQDQAEQTAGGDQDQQAARAAEIVVDRKQVLEQVRRAILEGKVPDLISAEEIQRRIAARIMAAPDVEATLELPAPLEGKERHFTPLEIRGVDWLPSALEGGPPVFAQMRAVNLYSGEEEVITTGAVNAMTQLLKADLEKGFPFRAQLEPAGKATAKGTYPEWLRPVPDQYRAGAGQES